MMTLAYWLPVLPEIALSLGSMLLLMIGAFGREKATSVVTYLTLAVLAVAATILIRYIPSAEAFHIFNDMFLMNHFTWLAKLIILAAAFFIVLLYAPLVRHKNAIACFEFPVVLLLAVIGMMILVSANDFIVLYLGLELQSLALYIMAAFYRDNERSSEAGLKYFILGALASGLMLYGMSLIYGFSGTTQFTTLHSLYAGEGVSFPISVLVGLIFVMISFCFKISAAPFHMWTPDVYQGAPTIATAFFAVAPKVAALTILVRLLMEPFGPWVAQWQQVIIVVSVLSMLIGALGAMRQKNIKRLMAYGSIGHVGYLLVGLASANQAGIQAILIYFMLYATMSVGVFACIFTMRKDGKPREEITDLAGLSRTHPLVAAGLAILMFSMAGIPPLAGFFGKMYIFLAALEANLYPLAVIGVGSSVIAAFYYLRIVKIMYIDEVKDRLAPTISQEVIWLIGGASAFNLLFFIYPTPVVDITATAVKVLFP